MKIIHSSPHMTEFTTHVIILLAVLDRMVEGGGSIVSSRVISTVLRITMDNRPALRMV